MSSQIEETCTAVKTLMNNDMFDINKQTSVITLINIVLNSNDYVNLIKGKVKEIKSDGKFDANDIPNVLLIILQSKAFLNTTIKAGSVATNTFKMDSLKYVVYAVIHFILLIEKVDPEFIKNIDASYSPLWEIIAFDPKELVINVSNTWRKIFPCCFSK